MRRSVTWNVVLAQAPRFNVGMAVVDLGLKIVARKLRMRTRIWRVGALVKRAIRRRPDLDARMNVGLAKTHLIEDAWPEGLSGPLLYWGDFQHMAQYIASVGRTIDRDTGEALSRRYLLLDGMPSATKSQSASFGTTLIFNSANDFMNDAYMMALEGLLTHNAAIWFRDPISTMLVRHLGRADAIETGVDPALFVDPSEIPPYHASNAKVGVYMGRTPQAYKGLSRIAECLASELEARLEWVDWGDGFPEMALPDPIHVSESNRSTSATESLSHLASCSAVVTDSYHAALVSWRLGIPAITVSWPVSDLPRSVNSGARWSWRDKRELAASQYGALDFVVHAMELEDSESLRSRIDHILEAVQDKQLMDHIRTRMESEAVTALSSIESKLLNN